MPVPNVVPPSEHSPHSPESTGLGWTTPVQLSLSQSALAEIALLGEPQIGILFEAKYPGTRPSLSPL